MTSIAWRDVATTAALATANTGRLGYRRLAALNAFWFGGGAHWQPISISLLPVGAMLVSTHSPELVVGRATAAGGIFAMLVPIFAGYFSDRTSSRWSRRRPWMVIGTSSTSSASGCSHSRGARRWWLPRKFLSRSAITRRAPRMQV
jgi:hypothetical protein